MCITCSYAPFAEASVTTSCHSICYHGRPRPHLKNPTRVLVLALSRIPPPTCSAPQERLFKRDGGGRLPLAHFRVVARSYTPRLSVGGASVEFEQEGGLHSKCLGHWDG